MTRVIDNGFIQSATRVISPGVHAKIGTLTGTKSLLTFINIITRDPIFGGKTRFTTSKGSIKEIDTVFYIRTRGKKSIGVEARGGRKTKRARGTGGGSPATTAREACHMRKTVGGGNTWRGRNGSGEPLAGAVVLRGKWEGMWTYHGAPFVDGFEAYSPVTHSLISKHFVFVASD